MKNIPKVISMVLALVLMLSLSIGAAFAETAAAEETRELALGESGYAITIPASYTAGEMTEEDMADDQIGYYKSEQYGLDFDVYEFDKAEDPVLADYIAKEAVKYNTTAQTREINGVTVAYYEATEENDGKEYATLTFVFEAGNEYVEIVFWMDGEEAPTLAETIIASLAAVTK